MSFNSQENKGLLWNTLVEAKLFNGIDNSKLNEIKIHFEITIGNISNIAITAQHNGRVFKLVDLNKQFMSEFSQYLIKFKQPPPPPTANITEVYTAEQRSEKRTSDFNYAVKQRQVQRETTEHKPKEIDFSKTLDEEPITDMDAQLQKMMAERDLVTAELQESDLKKAESWINNGQQRNLELNITDTPVNEKHVSFSEKDTTFIDTSSDNLNDPIHARMNLNKETSPVNVLDRLKTIPNTDNVSEKLSELITLVKEQTELIKSLVNK